LMPTREITITVLERVDEVKEALLHVEGVSHIEDLPEEHGRRRVRVEFNGDDKGVSALLQAISSRGIPVVNFSEETRDLEAVFMRATKGIVS
jgi:hypothetical protein